MKLGFFVPCYIDAIAPQAAISSFRLLRRLGLNPEFIESAACCGLPMKDMGYTHTACKVENSVASRMAGYDHIVMPSGICADQFKNHFDDLEQTPEVMQIREAAVDLVTFLHDIIKVDSLPWASFPHRVALHNGCHSLRYLNEARPSELMIPEFSKTADLLNLVEGIEVGYATRRDECCGFGGTFTIWDQSCSGQQGLDKVNDYARNGFRYVTSQDMSCLLHQSCVARKFGLDIKFYYIAEILNGDAK
ncbi:MAG: (Fe-S)-binding protein [Bacteroidales bacterium]|nr:(Fe-S)-binding protein [Bacteroidales bacterium]MBD5221655.1 (Fe-S)-binding protein [Bacteroidales bacterium]